MINKIVKYYTETFKKFGWVIPAIAVGVTFAIAIVLEATNSFRALLKTVAPLVWVLLVIGCVAVVAGIVYTVLNIKKSEVTIIDVCLVCISALTFLMIVMFLFTLGAGQWPVKWIVTSIVLVSSLVLTYFRAQSVR